MSAKARSLKIRKLTYAGVFLALAMVLPFLTGQIPEIGGALSPMHIPAFLCGFACGWPWGLAVGFVAPLLRFALFGMPPLMPTGLAMAFELAAYGALSGLLYKRLPRKTPMIYVALVLSMLGGRAVWGVVRYLLSGVQGTVFGLSAFWAGAFAKAVPGIVCHIALVPLIVLAMKKAGMALND